MGRNGRWVLLRVSTLIEYCELLHIWLTNSHYSLLILRVDYVIDINLAESKTCELWLWSVHLLPLILWSAARIFRSLISSFCDSLAFVAFAGQRFYTTQQCRKTGSSWNIHCSAKFHPIRTNRWRGYTIYIYYIDTYGPVENHSPKCMQYPSPIEIQWNLEPLHNMESTSRTLQTSNLFIYSN